MTRKVGASVKPVVTISRNADNVTIKSESTFKTVETTFQFDKEFDETTADDRKVKVAQASFKIFFNFRF